MDTDQELLEGARNAVRVCMNVGSMDRVLIVTDHDTESVGDALLREASAASANVACVHLEEYGDRPLAQLPARLAQRIMSFTPSVTFLAIAAKQGEILLRGQFIDMVTGKVGARHAHMPSITSSIVREGLRVDYTLIHKLTEVVHELLLGATSIHVTSTKGTDLHAEFSDVLKWVAFGGLYRNPGQWGNLPEGEVFTCPASVDGILVADVVGDYFSPKYGLLPDPVTVEIERGCARKVICANRELEAELLSYLSSKENGRRVGEFAVGTNIGVKALCGNLLQDEKIPGIHIAFGHPHGGLTGADWSCDTHVDMIPSCCTIQVDGKPLMEGGHFILPA